MPGFPPLVRLLCQGSAGSIGVHPPRGFSANRSKLSGQDTASALGPLPALWSRDRLDAPPTCRDFLQREANSQADGPGDPDHVLHREAGLPTVDAAQLVRVQPDDLSDALGGFTDPFLMDPDRTDKVVLQMCRHIDCRRLPRQHPHLVQHDRELQPMDARYSRRTHDHRAAFPGRRRNPVGVGSGTPPSCTAPAGQALAYVPSGETSCISFDSATSPTLVRVYCAVDR